MIATTFAGTDVFLITAQPSGDVKVTVSRLTERHASRTRREERRLLGATLRWQQSYTAIIDDREEAQAFSLALVAYGSVEDDRLPPVLCPFWRAAKPYGTALLFTAPIRCTWEPEFAQWELHTTPAPTGFTPTSAAMQAPVFWGRFDTVPDPALLNAEVPSVPISFVETGPDSDSAAYAIAPAAGITPTSGPVLHETAWPLIDCDIEYSGAKAGGADIQVDRQRVGYARGETETHYPQTAQRERTATMRGNETDAIRLIAAFHASGGTVRPVWFPSGRAATRVTADTSAVDLQIAVENAGALGGHPHIVLREFGGANIARTVTATTTNTLTVDAAPGAYSAGALSLQLLLFGRFLSDDLDFTWASSAWVQSQFALTELPPDYGAPAGEIYGQTLGAVGAPIFLLEVSDQVGATWRWTNYESPVTVAGHTYESKQYQWDKIDEGLNLDIAPLNLTCDSWIGNPFVRLTVPRRGQQIDVKLSEWDASGTSDPKQLFVGYASSAKKRGRVLTIPVRAEGTATFDLRIPRRIDGPTCPWSIYEPGCDLDPADFAIAATAVATVATLQFSVAVSDAVAAHFLAGGWAQRGTPGDGSVTYAIFDNTTASGGQLILTVDAPVFPALVAGEAWTLYPGCDQTHATCALRGNSAKFGGQWQKPAANPAFVPVQQTTPSTSKK